MKASPNDSSPGISSGGGPRRPSWEWVPVVWQIAHRRLVQSQVRLLGFSLLVGLVAGLAAVLFFVATVAAEHYFLGSLAGFEPEPHPAGEIPLAWLRADRHAVSALAAAGDSARRAAVHRLDRLHVRARGRRARHRRGDRSLSQAARGDRGRVPIVKIIASAITLGAGGSGGREGPIAQIGAGFGSFLAGAMRLRPAERRVLMAAGMGAGIAAIFRAPLAGSLFAAEVLYRSPEFEPEVIMPAALASVVSYSTFGVDLRLATAVRDPGARIQRSGRTGGLSGAGLVGGVFGDALHALVLCHHPLVPPFAACRGSTRRRRGFLTGVVALASTLASAGHDVVLGVLGFGYGTLQWALEADGRKPSRMLLAIALGKILHDGPDHRQRRIGRRVRAVDGDRRLRRRSDGIVLPAHWPAGRPRRRRRACWSAWPDSSRRRPKRRSRPW